MREHIVRSIESERRIPPAQCSCCGYRGKFSSFGLQLRMRANCPSCESKERHRLFALAMNDQFLDFRDRDVLHFAPEPIVYEMVKKSGARRVVTADITPDRADLVLNIENLAIEDNQFDRIVCSHVLEHVDDRAALDELYRVLTPGGYAVIMIPIIEGWSETFEDPSVREDADREAYFGQNDHVRFYGADFRERVLGAGFELHEYTADGRRSPQFALMRGEKVFRATKPVTG